ncbi:chorion peroxidase-like [Penaeus indicus]|uniref:chorion peroxidase-like n=1 Tax=Penaeus indicus TaxID=29960 RepID=UPI00300D78E9
MYGEAIPCCLQAEDNPTLLHPECAPIPIPADDPFYSKFDQTCMDFVRSAPAPRCLLDDPRSKFCSLFHTVWVRHHNHLASRLKSINPSWDDEKLFQETRRIVGAQLQHVTYEYLPPIFGKKIIKDFKLKPLKNKKRKVFYRPDKSAAISAEFATAAVRFGYSEIAGHMERVDDFGDISSTEMSSVAGNHFKGKNLFGLDLVELNIQRGCDHDIASYTAVRNSCELSPLHDFGYLSGKMDDDVIAKLEDVYRHVHDIDLFVGGLAEHPIEGGVVGPTFACILLDQFLRLKEGDRYCYEPNDKDTRFTKEQVKQIRSTTLTGIMCEVIPELKEIQAEPLKVASSEK